MKIFRSLTIMAFILMFSFYAEAQEIKFDFEDSIEGWSIPTWADEQGDIVSESIAASPEVASSGINSLAIMTDFPGDSWCAAVVEYEGEMDLTGYKTISVDIFLPKKVKTNLFRARFILTAGPWWRIEQRWPVELKRGKWTTLTADLDPEDELAYWRSKRPGESIKANINSVKKILVRIEYNASVSLGGPKYKGPIYIDNVVIKK
ncbi:MAG: hypothetical protein HQ594_00340 [Candidatus Omnitrophica bacterium]|nr:hypothetical protein [Candidatus Omnitrophota bacterium]